MAASALVPPRPGRVLVVDADRRVRQSLTGLIDLADDLEVVGAAADPGAAMALLMAGPVEVVLIDPRLPEVDAGMAFLTEAHRRWPRMALVAMSCFDEVERSTQSIGGLAFVAKSGQPEALIEALRDCVRATRSGPGAAA